MPFHSKLILLSKRAPSSRQWQSVAFSVSSGKKQKKRDSPVHRWIKSFDGAPSLVYCHSVYLLGCFSSHHWGTLYWIPLPTYALLTLWTSPANPLHLIFYLTPSFPKHTYIHTTPPPPSQSRVVPYPVSSRFLLCIYCPRSVSKLIWSLLASTDACQIWFSAFCCASQRASSFAPFTAVSCLNFSSHGVMNTNRSPREAHLRDQVTNPCQGTLIL